MAKNERTSKRVGKIASELLRSKKTLKKVKSVAGSALTQRPDRRKRQIPAWEETPCAVCGVSIQKTHKKGATSYMDIQFFQMEVEILSGLWWPKIEEYPKRFWIWRKYKKFRRKKGYHKINQQNLLMLRIQHLSKLSLVQMITQQLKL